jgi:hypothetical protein
MVKDGKAAPEIFSDGTAESSGAGRHFNAESGFGRPGVTRAEVLLTVWNDLPSGHRDELCRQIRKRCEAFVSSIGVQKDDRQNEADILFSEVVANILRVTTARR